MSWHLWGAAACLWLLVVVVGFALRVPFAMSALTFLCVEAAVFTIIPFEITVVLRTVVIAILATFAWAAELRAIPPLSNLADAWMGMLIVAIFWLALNWAFYVSVDGDLSVRATQLVAAVFCVLAYFLCLPSRR